MRITDSNIYMASARRYTAQGSGSAVTEDTGSAAVFTQFAKNAANTQTAETPEEGVSGSSALSEGSSLREELASIKSSLLEELLRRMLKSGMFGGTNGTFGGFGNVMGFGGISGVGSLGISMNSGGISFTQVNYAEEETTAFLAQGNATTEDGRTIDFDVNILMSRSFVQYTQINVPAFRDALYDPLMINTGSAVTRLSHQTFKFDLDMDGEEDNIAMPGKGSGFLALDLNEDGIINGGSELFGVKSGNGFEDLRAYDSDGNGWIDENDEVFSKLKVWYKNGDGTDELVDLKTADVGAIFLGCRDTAFSQYGIGMQLTGMTRATGIFLKESGGTGTIQHVDLAKQETPYVSPFAEYFLTEDADTNTGADTGAMVVHFGNQEQTEEAETGQSDRTQNKTDTKAERAKRRADAERERRQAQQKRRAAQEALKKEAQARLQRKKELRREELVALFEERQEQKELYEDMLAEKQEEHNALNAELLNADQIDTMADDQIAAVA